MSSSDTLCPECGHLVSEGQQFCANCGLSLGAPSVSPRSVLPPADDWDSVLESDRVAKATNRSRAQERARTGMRLTLAAFALLWIPYLQYLGSLLAFVGLIFLWFGRKAFDEPFRRGVVRGVGLVVLGLAVLVYVTILYVSQAVDAANTYGETVAQLGAAIQSGLVVLILGSLLSTVLVSIGYVALPYGRADRISRPLLWGAFTMAIALSVLQASILWPQVSTAVASATSGGVVNLGPVQTLQFESLELGLLQIIPDLTFFYAYYRIGATMSPVRAPGYPPSSISATQDPPS